MLVSVRSNCLLIANNPRSRKAEMRNASLLRNSPKIGDKATWRSITALSKIKTFAVFDSRKDGN